MQLAPPETLFYILLNDDMITNDVVTKHLCFDPLLTTFLPCLWSHHSCSLAGSAKWVLGEMSVLMLGTCSFGQQILSLAASDVLLLSVILHQLVQLLIILGFVPLGFWARPRGRHCEQLSKVLILLKLIFGIDLATVIQNRDMTFDLELDNFVVWTD